MKISKKIPLFLASFFIATLEVSAINVSTIATQITSCPVALETRLYSKSYNKYL
jgi:hypothetical protein